MKLLNQPQLVHVLLKLFREINNVYELLIINAGSCLFKMIVQLMSPCLGSKNKWYL